MSEISHYLDEPITMPNGEIINYTAEHLAYLIKHWKAVIANMPPGKIQDKDLQHLLDLPQKFESQLNFIKNYEPELTKHHQTA